MLHGNKIGRWGTEVLFVQLLQGAFQNLTSINLSWNERHSYARQDIACGSTVVPIIVVPCNLRHSNLLANQVTGDGIQALQRVMLNNDAFPSLETLDLGFNLIKDTGARAPVHIVLGRKFQRLHDLNINQYYIRDSGL